MPGFPNRPRGRCTAAEPGIFSCRVTVVAAEFAETVAGEKVAVASSGSSLALRLTAAGSVAPPTGVMINVYVAVPPPGTVAPLDPLTVSVKSWIFSVSTGLVAEL